MFNNKKTLLGRKTSGLLWWPVVRGPSASAGDVGSIPDLERVYVLRGDDASAPATEACTAALPEMPQTLRTALEDSLPAAPAGSPPTKQRLGTARNK